MFPGYKKPIEIDDQEFKLPKPSPRGKDKQVHLIQPSSDEIAERLKSRDLLENKALDWFVSNVFLFIFFCICFLILYFSGLSKN